MKTKSEIVQRLIEEKHIDAEEAVILLMMTEVRYIQPDNRYFPYIESPYLPPYKVTCNEFFTGYVTERKETI